MAEGSENFCARSPNRQSHRLDHVLKNTMDLLPGPDEGLTLEDAWPQGSFELLESERRAVRMQFDLCADTADERLRDMERFMARLPYEDRYLERINDHDYATRSNINAMLGLSRYMRGGAAPRRDFGPAADVVRCLLVEGLAVDGASVLSDEPILPCYVYATAGAGEALTPEGQENLVLKFARDVEARLRAREACDCVRYRLRLEQPGTHAFAAVPEGPGRSGALTRWLYLEAWKAGALLRTVAFSFKTYENIKHVAYGPSSGLILNHERRLLATPTIQFLMSYGIALESPETAKGVRVALSRHFEECDVILSRERPTGVVAETRDLVLARRATVKKYNSAAPGSGAPDPKAQGRFLFRGQPEARVPVDNKAPTYEPLFRRAKGWEEPAECDLMRLVTENYEDIDSCGDTIEEVMSPKRFLGRLHKAVRASLADWKERIKHSNDCADLFEGPRGLKDRGSVVAPTDWFIEAETAKLYRAAGVSVGGGTKRGLYRLYCRDSISFVFKLDQVCKLFAERIKKASKLLYGDRLGPIRFGPSLASAESGSGEIPGASTGGATSGAHPLTAEQACLSSAGSENPRGVQKTASSSAPVEGAAPGGPARNGASETGPPAPAESQHSSEPLSPCNGHARSRVTRVNAANARTETQARKENGPREAEDVRHPSAVKHLLDEIIRSAGALAEAAKAYRDSDAVA